MPPSDGSAILYAPQPLPPSDEGSSKYAGVPCLPLTREVAKIGFVKPIFDGGRDKICKPAALIVIRAIVVES